MGKRDYTGFDRVAGGKRAGLEKLVDLLEREFGLWNNGTWVVRRMRNKVKMSVHSTVVPLICHGVQVNIPVLAGMRMPPG